MGREAICTCDWGGTVSEVKALLETGEIIVRGGIRKRLAFSELSDVKVQSDALHFKAGPERVQLNLGAAAAEKWAATITSPPTALSKKLGITKTSVVRTIGAVPDETLQEALAEAARVSTKEADLIVAYVDSPESLHSALRASKAQLLKGVPIWIVYPKGPGHAINETAIRSLLRENGMIDTKVASVSSKFTALRFIYRKPE
ncbi:MAG: hypothetical protein ABSF28_01705 [Terracidiphilus sp.]|jgi:hypothetical protein